MNSVLDESKFERGDEVQGDCAVTCCGLDPQEAAKRIEKGLNGAKAAVSAKMDDAKIAAERLLKRGRYAVEDGLGETTHMIKRHPVSSVAIAFAAGAALSLSMLFFARKSSAETQGSGSKYQ